MADLEKKHHGTSTSFIAEKIFEKFFLIVGLTCLLVLLLIMIFLFTEGIPILKDVSLKDFIRGTQWYPTSETPRFGILPLITASVAVTLLASLFAVPLSLAIAV